jgi:hypothetical protein
MGNGRLARPAANASQGGASRKDSRMLVRAEAVPWRCSCRDCEPVTGRNAMSVDKFIYCPQCKSDKIEETDYENEDGSTDDNGRRCAACGWEGDVGELLCEGDV